MGAVVKESVFSNRLIIKLIAAWILATSPIITREPLKRSKNPISTPAALVAISAAIITASLGVIVRIPIASWELSFKPSFL